MKRTPHRPSLNEGAVLPKSALNGATVEFFDSGPQSQDGRGQHLGVQPTEAACDREHAPGWRALIEVVAANPPSRNLWPSKLQQNPLIRDS